MSYPQGGVTLTPPPPRWEVHFPEVPTLSLLRDFVDDRTNSSSHPCCPHLWMPLWKNISHQRRPTTCGKPSAVSSAPNSVTRATARGWPAFKRSPRRHVPVADWVLIDAGDVIVHLFRPEVRSFYNLERMWGFGDEPAAAAGRA